jgi:DNA-binding HxlR family transcriptional regulator
MSSGNTRDTVTCAPHIQQTAACAARDLLDRLADKWSLLVVELLGPGPRRFTELRREIDGISQRMLTLTLRNLERDGLVRRTVYPVVPPRVDYELTMPGASLLAAVQPLRAWVRAHHDSVAAARTSYDTRTDPAGESTKPAIIGSRPPLSASMRPTPPGSEPTQPAPPRHRHGESARGFPTSERLPRSGL